MIGLGLELTVAVPALAWFTAINAAGSIGAAVAARRFEDRLHGDAARARRLLAVRLAPAALSLIVTATLFLPAHAWLEPVRGDERIGAIPLGLAALGLALLLAALGRGAGAIRTIAHLTGSLPGRRLPDDRAPLREVQGYGGITLAGIIRPKILIGTRARQVLTRAELALAVAHEHAHLQARDNLSRMLIHCAPDFLGWFRPARRLERLWAGEAECLADATAASGSAVRARRLAAALVKVARLGGGELSLSPMAPGWSAFHHPLLIETRVRFLVSGARRPAAPAHWGRRAAAWGSAGIAAAWLAGVPERLHRITEELIAFLP